MEQMKVPPDDVIDIMEMAHKIERFIYETLNDTSMKVAVSVLISASINCLLSQCKTMDDATTYRNLFVEMLDRAVTNIRIHNPEKH